MANPVPWTSLPASLPQPDGAVHVWLASLELPPDCLARLARTLSADEAARAEGFRFERDRRRFVAARGVLRWLLGRYAGEEPARLRFRYGPRGKPALASGGKDLEFNLSHAHERVVFAVARGRRVGVDIEHVQPLADADALVERFFSVRERETFRALPAAHRQAAFYRAWTRKEAFIKARGEGLSCPLDRFDVSLAPGEPPALLATRPDPPEADRWALYEIVPEAAYLVALAVEGRDAELAVRRLDAASACAPPPAPRPRPDPAGAEPAPVHPLR